MKRDELGPEAVIDVYEPKCGLRGVLVVDNSIAGPCGGGTRMAPDITVDEVAALARGMTYKFAAFGLPRGGSKAGIFADPRMDPSRRRDILLAFGRALAPFLRERDVAIGPDMGVTVDDVKTIYEGAECPDVRSGLFAREVEGDPAAYHLTGYGVASAARVAVEHAGNSFKGATAAIEGFGQVGVGTARYADKWGAKVVAVSTIRGGVYNPDGLDVEKLMALRRQHGDDCVLNYEGGEKIDPSRLYFLDVDVMVPGARPYVINAFNARDVRAKVVCSAANIAVTEEAEEVLFGAGVMCLPDFIVNSGGALASWVDFLGGTPEQAFEVLGRLISSKVGEVLAASSERKQNPCSIARAQLWRKLLTAERRRPTFAESKAQIRDIFGL